MAVSILVYSVCNSLIASEEGRVSGVQSGVVNTFCISSNCRYNVFTVCTKVNDPYQVPYKLKAASAALLHCFFGFLTTSGNFSDHGSRSSKNDRSLSSMRLGISVRRCSKYSYGFRLFAFAVSAML